MPSHVLGQYRAAVVELDAIWKRQMTRTKTEDQQQFEQEQLNKFSKGRPGKCTKNLGIFSTRLRSNFPKTIKQERTFQKQKQVYIVQTFS